MRFNHYKQYFPDGVMTLNAVKNDIFEEARQLYERVDSTLFDDDCHMMTVTVAEFEAGDDEDIGDYVSLADDVPYSKWDGRSHRFIQNYVRVLNGDLKDWHPVRVDINMEEIRIFYIRFCGENGLSDMCEVLSIKYPPKIVLCVEIDPFEERDDMVATSRELYRLEVANLNGQRMVTINEYFPDNHLMAVRCLKEGEKGLYAETTLYPDETNKK